MELSNLAILAFILALVGVAVLPLGGIWALNTLFATGLEYTFMNWCAVLFAQLYVQIIIKSGSTQTKQKKSE